VLPESKIDSSEYTDLNRVIGWFITLRWIAFLGVVVTLLIVNFLLNYVLPYSILYILTSVLFLINSFFTYYYAVVKQKNLLRKEMSVFFHVQVCTDYLLLFLLIYFTGFLENPFCYYFVFHIMLTSFIFPASVVFIYVTILVVVFIGVAFAEYLQLLPHFALKVARISPGLYEDLVIIRVVGLCSTIIISAYLITSIKNRIVERGKRVEVELNRYKSLDKIKSNFILQVTHELRGPLAALKGYHEMIMKGITGEIPEKTRDTLKKANQRTSNLLTMIDEMIDFAYMRSEEEVEYTKTELNIKEALDYNINQVGAFSRQKGIRFIPSCPRELKIWSNRDLLNIILNNLFTNSIKYSPPDTKVLINAIDNGKEVELTVKDEGYGIEPEELDKVFEEFYRTRKAREVEKDGTGLGLPIVKRAVESLGGKITVYSEINRGTSFHITLPKDK